jgi:hypothetical protein
MRAALCAPFLVVAIGGCATWDVLQQATPNPLSPQTQLAVESTTFKDATATDESFGAAFTAALVKDRGTLDIGGADQLAGRFVIRSSVELLVPGEYKNLLSTPTRTATRVSIMDASGKVVDEIRVECKALADAYRPTLAERLRECGRRAGYDTARYLHRRVAATR